MKKKVYVFLLLISICMINCTNQESTSDTYDDSEYEEDFEDCFIVDFFKSEDSLTLNSINSNIVVYRDGRPVEYIYDLDIIEKINIKRYKGSDASEWVEIFRSVLVNELGKKYFFDDPFSEEIYNEVLKNSGNLRVQKNDTIYSIIYTSIAHTPRGYAFSECDAILFDYYGFTRGESRIHDFRGEIDWDKGVDREKESPRRNTLDGTNDIYIRFSIVNSKIDRIDAFYVGVKN